MKDEDVNLILEENNLTILEKLEFASEKETLDFLKKIETLSKNKIDLSVINNDLKNILLQIKLDKNILNLFKRINFQDYSQIIINSQKNKITKEIYNNFIKFLELETGLKPNKLFEINKEFDIEKDTKSKAEKFEIDILFDYNQGGKKNTVNDFILYFNKRLEYFNNLLSNKIDAENLMRISSIKDLYGSNKEVKIIGLISEINTTKNGHIILTIEDRSGEVKCFINKDKLNDKVFNDKIENLCLDEGIAISGKIGKEIIWVDNIITTTHPEKNEFKTTKDEEYIVCLGDLHIGAKVFADNAYQKFINWIQSKTNNEELNVIAKKVKYIIIVGDLIEGLGIYPGQGKDARIISTELQYHKAAQLLSQIPKNKHIINISGNHDTNRLSEPQQKLPYHKAYPLYNMGNLINLSNPRIIKLFKNNNSTGLDFYLYHGGSLLYYADKIKPLREKGGAKVPEEVVKYLLDKRHIAPSHGSTLCIPDSQQDPLTIKNNPDFFITGHTHKMSVATHNGWSILCTGCWVKMSAYQEKMGLFPDIGKCILVNTKTRKTKILNFYKQ